MKPVECGALVLFDEKWHGRKIISAIPTGKSIPSDTLEWLKAYSREHSLPLLFYERVLENRKFVATKRFGYGPPSFIHAVKTEVGPEDITMF